MILECYEGPWAWGLDAKKSWVVLSALLGGFAPHLGGHSYVYGEIGAPLQGQSSREVVLSAVMDDLVIALANKD